mmetsp:Transcript_60470/g.168938  ORF Transcript_60470/g.168938 Transcript_60470/m.168938 type:complete len:278 (+) Transcript_60470:89-922(+)
MEVMASVASLWPLKVIQHSWLPISKSSNSPKGLKMPRMSSSVTTGLRFLMWSLRMFGPASDGATLPVLSPLSTCCVNCWRVIMRFGAGLPLLSWASARFTCTTIPKISLFGGAMRDALPTASSCSNSTMTTPVSASRMLRMMRMSAMVPYLLKCLKRTFSSALGGTPCTITVLSTLSTAPVNPPKGAIRELRDCFGGLRDRSSEPPDLSPPCFSFNRFLRNLRLRARALFVKSLSSSKKEISAASNDSTPIALAFTAKMTRPQQNGAKPLFLPPPGL